MGATLAVLRSYVEDQLSIPTTTSSTEVKLATLNSYINEAIRRIYRMDRPVEALISTPSLVNITSASNSVSKPSTVLVSTAVWYETSSSTVYELVYKPYEQLVGLEGASAFFDTSNQGDPKYYCIRGSLLLFNKYFSDTRSNAIKIMGISVPTTLTADSDTTDLPEDYNFLIAYESCVLFYQRDDDIQNDQKFSSKAQVERARLKTFLNPNSMGQVVLDPRMFSPNYRDMRDPSVFFGSI